MALSLDPNVNPILRLYGLFHLNGVRTTDEQNSLGVGNLGLKEFGSDAAQALVEFMRRIPRGVLGLCQLNLAHVPVVNFSKDLIWDWFEWESIEQLAATNKLCEGCYADIFQPLKDDLAEKQLLSRPLDKETVKSYLSLLDELASCAACGDHFSLEVTIEKQRAVKCYLLGAPVNLAKAISANVWYSPDFMEKAFGTFKEFLEDIALRARRPLALFFYETVEEYLGEYFKILTLGDSSGEVPAREQALVERLGEFTAGVVSQHHFLRKKYRREERGGLGDKYYLSPAFFLRRPQQLSAYPQHALFTSGPLRPTLVYAIFAWLAKEVYSNTDATLFKIPAAENKTRDLSLVFSLKDVRLADGGLFDGPNWKELLGLLAFEISQCVGNACYRKHWSEALVDHAMEGLEAHSLFEILEQVRLKYVELMKEPTYISRSSENVELRIFLDSKMDNITYELTFSPDYFRKSVGFTKLGEDKDLPRDTLNKLARRYFDKIATRDLEPDEEITRAESDADLPEMNALEINGKFLWDKLIPRELKEALGELIQQQQSGHQGLNVFIVSDDSSFPWELVMPYQKGVIKKSGSPDEWLSLKFPLARWITGSPYPADGIAARGICCMASGQTPNSALEIKALKALAAECGVEFYEPQTRAELLKVLEEKEYSILHFACHGEYNKEEPEESAIRLRDGKLLNLKQLFYTGNVQAMIEKNRPLVFLNSCHSGRTGPTLTGIEGWANEFIRNGCGAFIGCGWEVSDPLAAQFAKTFYEAFKDGKTLGRAVHKARVEMMKTHPKNSTWLAYYLYGNPDCTFLTNFRGASGAQDQEES
ncbi:MAG TPA: CHAT domain-containing protein [Pyrinomonadaceae bacterium]|jgi:hypothetical protein